MGAEDLMTDSLARDIATLPAREGGLGLRSAARSSGGAVLASWMDTLPVIAERLPPVAEQIRSCLRTESSPGALGQAQRAHSEFTAQGLVLPTWQEIENGAQPPQPELGLDAADIRRGWQTHACSFVEHSFREHVVMPQCDEPRQALLHSQSGGAGPAWLRAIPSEPALQMTPLRFQTSMRRRLRWSLPLWGGQCCKGCRQELDPKGDRAASCPASGRIKLRSTPIERMWARVLREAKARVRDNVLLRDTAEPGIDPADGRKVEIVAAGLPMARGLPVVVDVTMVSPLHADGSAWAEAAYKPGISFKRAPKSKEKTYPELARSTVLHLVVAAMETGGRLSHEAVELLDAAAVARAKDEPRPLRRQAARAWKARWSAMISIAGQDTLAATLVSEGTRTLDCAAGEAPPGTEVWLDAD